MVLALGCLAAGVGPTAGVDTPENPAIEQDRKQYEGTWLVVSLQVNGVQASLADLEKITVVNRADGTWVVKFDGKEVGRGTSRIDPTQYPKAIDLTATEEGGKVTKFLGIYALAGDSRKVCFAPPGQDRPADFSSPPGSGHILVVLQRERK
jgi:uncharacterized protein (TIGR03067 family)